jgi:AraC-like DNA-binding protein
MPPSYREYPAPPALRPVVACVWEQEPVAAHTHRIIPDGCVDLIWLADGELVIAGADTGPRLVQLPARALSTGIRLRPGVAGASRDPRPEELVLAAACRLTAPRARVADVAADLGISERQLRRRTLSAVGFGPKLLARVTRLRRLVRLGDEPLAGRALAAGYASQAHMSDEVRRLTGLTPVRFLEDAALTAA